jgi:hypothetical protein
MYVNTRTSSYPYLESAAPGLDLICEGIRLSSLDDQTALERGAMVYDALDARLKFDLSTRE